MFMIVRRFVLACALLAISGLSTPMAADASSTRTPATLNTETLVGLEQNVTASCNPDGTSTISYWVAGKAGALDASGSFSASKGPYPGTFVEQGTLTMGPQAVSGTSVTPASVLTWTASFTIVSSAGIVKGTTSLTGPGSTGLCLVEPNGQLTQAAWGTSPPYNYSYAATISSTRLQGTFADSGESYPQLFAPYPWSSSPNSFFEQMTSSQTTTTALST